MADPASTTPLRVGLTGSIASGKTTVARRLKDRGIPVIDLDKVGHEVLRKRHEAFEPVVQAFGEDILGPDGEIDRKALGAVIFNDAAARERLNKIVHPKIRDEEARRFAAMAESGVVAVVTEAALLIETGQRSRFDFFVVVGCTPEIQIDRLLKRDGCSVEEARKRIATQLSFEEKKAEADYVIDTSGAREDTLALADKLAEEIKVRAAAR
ncbi:MAG: dephospho-CoA kinase [Vicinamibacteria bacterium]